MPHRCSPACTKGWGPTRKCHCSTCGADFTTPRNFDRHTPPKCQAPNKVGLVLNDKGIWTMPGEEDISERFKR